MSDRRSVSSDPAHPSTGAIPRGSSMSGTIGKAPASGPRPKAGNKDGSIRLLPSGRYGLRVQLGVAADGKPIRPHVTGATKTEVKRKRDELVARHRAGAPVDPVAERRTLGAYLRAWLEGKRAAVEPSTWHAYRFHVEGCLIPLLGRLPVGGLRPDDVRGAHAALAQPPYSLAPRTIRHVHVRLKQALGQAVRDGTLARNVAEVVEGPKVPRGEVKALAPENVQRLLATAKGEWRTLWLLALYSGMRLGELLGLPWTAVTWDVGDGSGEGTITVQQVLAAGDAGNYVVRPYPKSRSGVRTIRVPAEVVAELRAHRHRQLLRRAASPQWEDVAGLVFLTRWGTTHLPGNVIRALKRAAKRAGIEGDVHPHLLRHTFASSLLLAGRPITEVAYLLGHASAATTLSVYAHWIRGGGGGAAAALSRLYGGAPENVASEDGGGEDGGASSDSPSDREQPRTAVLRAGNGVKW